ncbi:MAG TPA: hypothetical protein VKE40_23545 [Gemmataceae bacterium]|nr:hypothetical protein [Gemmataceae bacterium]
MAPQKQSVNKSAAQKSGANGMSKQSSKPAANGVAKKAGKSDSNGISTNGIKLDPIRNLKSKIRLASNEFMNAVSNLVLEQPMYVMSGSAECLTLCGPDPNPDVDHTQPVKIDIASCGTDCYGLKYTLVDVTPGDQYGLVTLAGTDLHVDELNPTCATLTIIYGLSNARLYLLTVFKEGSEASAALTLDTRP